MQQTSTATLTRRGFLYSSAVAAGGAILSACSSSTKSKASKPSSKSTGGGRISSDNVGSVTTPLPRPASFNEAPALKGRGLPPVAERLPDNPYVVPHKWIKPGKYGGTLNMVVFGTTGMASASSVREFFYGYSPTRWLNDGLDLGPGSADKWSSNADATEWTIHFRAGLKWSDGTPFTVEDILFWYNDMARPGYAGESVPADCLSSKGNPCEMSKVNDSTLKIKYDAPQPLLADYLASWVKSYPDNGPTWILPKHYLKQFHPKYNPKVPKDWAAPGGLWEQKFNWMGNPDCPTLIGYKCKSFDNNKGVVFERNPYYYAVAPNGDQLPYIDVINVSLVDNAQVLKLQVQQGKVDYCDGHFNQIDVSDVSTLSKTKQRGGYEILLWDSGVGAGAPFMFNYDYIAKDEKYGKLFRDKRFRQALSHSYDRETIRKTLFFQTGELSTGTDGTKSAEFNAGDEARHVYRQWRDSYVTHDIAKAKKLLASMGLKDTNGDGYVEFPDGSKLTVDVPYRANQSTTFSAKDDILVASAKSIGLRMQRVPIGPQAWVSSWNEGSLMSRGDKEASGQPNLITYADLLLPANMGNTWAPLESAWTSMSGDPKQKAENSLPPIKRHPPRLEPESDGPVARLLELYNAGRQEADAIKQRQIVWEIVKIHIDEGPFFMGAVANYPQVVIAKTALKNVPARENLMQHGWVNPWTCPCPATYDPEAFFWENPAQHA